ncbi:MAG: hypothetical protein ACXWOT_02060 [Candidatus Limnocylindrales bacterium]
MSRAGVLFCAVLLMSGCSAAGSAEPISSPSPTTVVTPTGDAVTATDVAERYERAIAGADWPTAWSALAPGPFRPETYQEFVRSRESPAAQASAYRRFVVSAASRDPALLETWIDAALAADLALRADPARACVVIVDHPDVPGASASLEVLVVAPLLDGSWRIWRAH